MSDKTGNLYNRTRLRNGGRVAGTGVSCDDYSEESLGDVRDHYVHVRLPHDGEKPEELNGPVICYKAGERDKRME